RRCLSVIQACCAFQTIGGTVQRAKTPVSRYKPGRANCCRNRGANASTSTTEMNSRPFVYLQRNPSPINRPVAGQYHENRGLCASASQKANIAANQKKIDNGSIVMR